MKIKKTLKFVTTFLIVGMPLIFVSCNDTGGSDGKSPSEEQVVLHDVKADNRADDGGSGVMLQGFTWTSPNDDGTWYTTISNNASEIKDVFEYVWFPPATDCTDNNGNGYLPRQLNMLTQAYTKRGTHSSSGEYSKFYGTEDQLKQAIADIKPAKAIADVVINHRCGTTDWGDFTNPDWGVVKKENYSAICRDDEGFTNSSADMFGCSKKGAKDTGDSYDAARDIDHTNLTVQDGIITWMNDVLKSAGFVGWRYDMVKGYSGVYNGYYNAMTKPVLSVGEYWDGNVDALETWVKSTVVANRGVAGVPSRAFDFALKFTLNKVFGEVKTGSGGVGNSDFNKLAETTSLFRKLPGYSVTFIDNHDTGSTQAECPMDPQDMGAAYAFILTHPGIPCVAWFHYFATSDCPGDSGTQYLGGKTVAGTTITLKQHIKNLIELRKDAEITDLSAIEILKEESTGYAAKITGGKKTVVVAIGEKYTAPAGFTEEYGGTDFQIFVGN